MRYVNPETVITPKNRVRSVHVIHDTGAAGWSVALLDWNGEEAVAIRWNGQGKEIGNPQSHGRPTWFVVPEDLGHLIRERAEELSAGHRGMLAGYREMANDGQRESEAQEWSEGLIADAAGQER